MTDEEKRAINRRLLEFCGWADFIDHGPKTVHISRYEMRDAMGRLHNLPDLFGGAESAHLRERLMLKLNELRCFPDGPCQLSGFFVGFNSRPNQQAYFAHFNAGYVANEPGEDGEEYVPQWQGQGDTYAEAFCMAAIRTLEAQTLERQAENGQ